MNSIQRFIPWKDAQQMGMSIEDYIARFVTWHTKRQAERKAV